jgi:hypothetical protein
MIKSIVVTTAIAIGMSVSGLAVNPALAMENANWADNASQSAALSSGGAEQLMHQLRRMPNLPGVLLHLAERAYRLYRLYQLGEEVRGLREENLRVLRELAKLAARLEQGELRLRDIEAMLKQHDRTIAILKGRLENKTAKKMAK